MFYKIEIETKYRDEIIDITSDVESLVPNEFSWICVVYTPHTTCGITINEWYDPDVARDLLYWFSKHIPQTEEFRHLEWNSDAHIKSSLIWVSQTLIVENWNLILWTWQKILFCEFDWPRRRKVYVKFLKW